jgi:hypothetical protein
LWTVHPRLRTKRSIGDKKAKGRRTKLDQTAETQPENKWFTREKRKFGEAGKVLGINRPANVRPEGDRQPNFFADFAGLQGLIKKYPWLEKEWTSATIPGESNAPPLIHGKSFWSTVKAIQWDSINSVNEARLAKWRKKAR